MGSERTSRTNTDNGDTMGKPLALIAVGVAMVMAYAIGKAHEPPTMRMWCAVLEVC